jgi:hypothetical protein
MGAELLYFVSALLLTRGDDGRRARYGKESKAWFALKSI